MGQPHKESGIGLLFALLMNLGFFFGVPALAEMYWPTFMRLKAELNMDIYPYMVAHVTLF